MRRFWAHILIAFAAIVAVFALTPSLLKQITTNAEFKNGRQFTFQLKERTKNEGEADPAKLDGESAKKMAKIMEERLKTYGVDSYKVNTSGNEYESDIVTVSFYATDEQQYKNIVTYLTFSGSFAFMNKPSEGAEGEAVVVSEKEFRNGNAYLQEASVNDYPTIILPVSTGSTNWTDLVAYAKEHPETSGDEESSTESVVLYLMYNFESGDTPQKLVESDKWSEKVFIPFNYDTNFDESNAWFKYQVNYSDANGNGVADAKEIRAAFDNANYLLNLFNASALDYDVECIRGLTSETRVNVPAGTEKITENAKLVWNATLTAIIAAFVIVTLLIAVFYKLGAISAMTTTSLTVFLAFLFMVKAEMLYSVLAVVALVAVGIISLCSTVVYLNKLKEDAYKGHTLKKANTEASKKSLLPIIDINLVGAVIGIMVYLLGGTSFHAFGAILGLGSLISLILNTIGLKLMMWLPTNATKLSGKYGAFGINPENVPNHMAEEKQRFFGAYEDKDFTKKKKPVGIIAASLFVIALVGILVGVSVKGSLVKQESSKVINQQIYVTNTYDVKKEATDNKLNENTLKSDVLDKILLYSGKDEADVDVYTPLKEYVKDVSNYTTFQTSEDVTPLDEETITYKTTYYIVTLKSTVSLNTKSYFLPQTALDADELHNTLAVFAEETPYKVSFKTSETYVTTTTVEWGKVVAGTAVAIAILTVYLMLRYRLSRGLTSLVFPVLGSAVTLGLLMLANFCGMSLPITVIAAIPVVVILSYVFMILIMNREREMVIDDKTRDVSIEHRKELSTKALGVAMTPVLASAVLGIYMLVDFFGFGVVSSSYIYLAAMIGALITLGFVMVLYMPIANFFFALFKKVSIERKPRKSKKNKNNKPVKKSAEPEEAIFIGIND